MQSDLTFDNQPITNAFDLAPHIIKNKLMNVKLYDITIFLDTPVIVQKDEGL